MTARRSRAPVTPATTALDALGVAWTPHAYDHDPAATDFGAEAVRALGVPAERVLKTLVVEVAGRTVVAVVPVSSQLDPKALATALGAKHAVLAAPADAERRTGYVVGGISPLGRRTPSPTVLDASIERLPTVYVSGGRRGFDVELAPADLVRATGGLLAPIAGVR